MATLAALDLERVIEIHVAGGGPRGGQLSPGDCITPAPVLELLRYALLSCPNVGGVTFELPGTWYSVLGEEGLVAELRRLRSLWHRYQPLPSRLAS